MDHFCSKREKRERKEAKTRLKGREKRPKPALKPREQDPQNRRKEGYTHPGTP